MAKKEVKLENWPLPHRSDRLEDACLQEDRRTLIDNMKETRKLEEARFSQYMKDNQARLEEERARWIEAREEEKVRFDQYMKDNRARREDENRSHDEWRERMDK